MYRKIFGIGFGLIFLGAIGAVAFAALKPAPTFRGTAFRDPYPDAVDFELSRADGSTFRMSDQRGKIVLLFFGYTFCPDVCPTTLAQMKQMHIEISKPDMVKVVFISVDPMRDTPKIMQDYVDHFDPTFIGLGGKEAALEKIWSNYGVTRIIPEDAKPDGNYTVDHTARVTLIDPNGKMRLSYPFETPTNDILHDIELMLSSIK